MAKLGDICTIYSGTGFPVQYQGTAEGQYPFYKVGDIAKNVTAGNKYLVFCENYVETDIVKIIKGTVLPSRTVVFAKIGEAVKLNRRAITSCECLIDNNAMGIAPNESVLTLDYFFHYMCSLRLETLAEATTVPSVKKSLIEKLDIPLPSLLEQEKISTMLNKVSELITLRREQLAKLDQLVKSRFIELFGDPKYNKTNLVKIGEIGVLTSGGTPSRAKPEYFEGDIRWYSAGELNSLYLPDSVEHISETALQQSPAKLFNKGTLMIGMYDTAAFKMGILTEDSSSNQACANLNPQQGYSVVWLYYLFDIMKPIFLQERQGVRQKNLSLSKINEFEVPCAPFELQDQFAAFVEQTNKSKLVIQQSLDKLELLKKSLMQEYFG